MLCKKKILLNIAVFWKVNTEKTKYILMSYHWNARQNHNKKIANRSFENVGMIVTSHNLIHMEIKNRLNLSNACYHSVQNLFFSLAV
jgi:hypothetical protein